MKLAQMLSVVDEVGHIDAGSPSSKRFLIGSDQKETNSLVVLSVSYN
jgi:hypothetical protein